MDPDGLLATKTRLAIFIVLLNAVIFGIATLLVLFSGREAAQAQLYITIVIFGFLAAIATFTLSSNSSAELSGTYQGVAFKLIGPLAAGAIVSGLLWAIAPGNDSRVVRFILTYVGKQLAQEFSLTPTMSGADVGKRTSQNFQIALELPSHISAIDGIALECPGYVLQNDAPYEIVEGIVKLAVVSDMAKPRTKPGGSPSVTIFSDLPSRDAVAKQPATPPKDCELQYRNKTTERLRLIILDCSRYYKDNPNNDPWLDFPFDPSNDFQGYDHFDNTTGWYCFAVEDSTGMVVPLEPAAKNICERRQSKLTVTSTRPGHYVAVWE